MAEQTMNMVLTDYSILVKIDNDDATNILSNLANELNTETDPSKMLSSVESVAGVSGVVIKDLRNNQIVIDSSPLTPDE
jgi:hypothetical protein